MSLAKATGVNVPHNTETDVATFTGDGIKKLLGFVANCPVDAVFTLKIGGNFEASVRTTVQQQTAEYYDRLQTVGNGVQVKVTCLQTSGATVSASATILGA